MKFVRVISFFTAILSSSVYANEIDKVAWLTIKDKQLLVARSKGKEIFYVPGGKREGEESDQETLVREIREEMSVEIIPTTILYAETFRSQAHEKNQGTMVNMTCYFAEFKGEIAPSSEIEEVSWVSYEDKSKCSEVTQKVMDWLNSEGLI